MLALVMMTLMAIVMVKGVGDRDIEMVMVKIPGAVVMISDMIGIKMGYIWGYFLLRF